MSRGKSAGAVRIDFVASSAQFVKGVLKNEKAIERFKRSAKSVARSIRRNWRVMTAAVAGFVVGVGVAIKKMTDYSSTLVESARTTGLTVKQLESMRSLFQGDGIGIQRTDKAMQEFNVRIGFAQRGVGQYTRAFEKLGISMKRQDGSFKSQNELLTEVAGALQKTGTESEAASLAYELFGRAGKDLLPIFRKYGLSLDDNARKANRYRTVTEDQHKANKDLGQEFTNLAENAVDLVQRGLAPMGPAVAEAIKDINEMIIALKEGFESAGNVIAKVLGWVGDLFGKQWRENMEAIDVLQSSASSKQDTLEKHMNRIAGLPAKMREAYLRVYGVTMDNLSEEIRSDLKEIKEIRAEMEERRLANTPDLSGTSNPSGGGSSGGGGGGGGDKPKKKTPHEIWKEGIIAAQQRYRGMSEDDLAYSHLGDDWMERSGFAKWRVTGESAYDPNNGTGRTGGSFVPLELQYLRSDTLMRSSAESSLAARIRVLEQSEAQNKARQEILNNTRMRIIREASTGYSFRNTPNIGMGPISNNAPNYGYGDIDTAQMEFGPGWYNRNAGVGRLVPEPAPPTYSSGAIGGIKPYTGTLDDGMILLNLKEGVAIEIPRAAKYNPNSSVAGDIRTRSNWMNFISGGGLSAGAAGGFDIYGDPEMAFGGQPHSISDDMKEIWSAVRDNKIREKLEEYNQTMERTRDITASVRGSFERLGSSIISNMDNAGEAVKAFGKDLIDVFFQRQVMGPLSNTLFGEAGSSGGGLFGGLIGSIFGGGDFAGGKGVATLATGGLGTQGMALVGEEGPELVDFSRPGMVYNNDQLKAALSGGGGITIINNINSTDGPGVQRALSTAMPGFVAAAQAATLDLATRPGPARSAFRG